MTVREVVIGPRDALSQVSRAELRALAAMRAYAQAPTRGNLAELSERALDYERCCRALGIADPARVGLREPPCR